MDLLQQIKERAKKAAKTIVLCEGNDIRVQQAAKTIAEQGIAKIIMLADKSVLASFSAKNVLVLDPSQLDLSEYAQSLFELRKEKGLTREAADELVKNPLYLGALMVQKGEADGMVAGAANSTGDVLRPALQIIKTAKGISVVSSCFIMLLPNQAYGENGVMVFGDCAIIPEPTAEQLAVIAISSAQSAQKIAGISSPKVAMLSFSTKGSAKHIFADKAREAANIASKLNPQLLISGELQADAALVESVAMLKAPNDCVAGAANVLIFPDLQSGNIGYKLVERLAGATALGPICQGFNKPVNDLSRGCSAEDIVGVVAITALQC